MRPIGISDRDWAHWPKASNEVAPRITVGPKSLIATLLDEYDAVVSCLREDLDDPRWKTDSRVAIVRLTDDAFEIVKGDWARACQAAAWVVDHHRRGDSVYIFCREGLNRSGLVAALAVRELHGLTGARAVEIIQSERQGALYNWHFRSALQALGRPDGTPLSELPQPVVRR